MFLIVRIKARTSPFPGRGWSLRGGGAETMRNTNRRHRRLEKVDDFVMGATGYVGSAVAETRLALGDPVGIITHDPGHADSWRDTKAELIDADVNDVPSLRTRLPTFC